MDQMGGEDAKERVKGEKSWQMKIRPDDEKKTYGWKRFTSMRFRVVRITPRGQGGQVNEEQTGIQALARSRGGRRMGRN